MSGGGSVFLLAGNGELVQMTEKPYEAEEVLQKLLAEYPALLAGDQMGHDEPRRWLIVSREVSMAGEEEGVGRLDHAFIDHDGVPTLVEVKRSSDRRIRREVVGQLLDYAANAVLYWPVEQIRARFEQTCLESGVDPAHAVQRLTESEDVDEFWGRVATNLTAGRIRLVFVADEIPAALRRIIEFLNEQMSPAEVLGVEVRQYADPDGKTQSLVPRVLGLTAAAERKKPGSSARPHWTEAKFFEVLTERSAEEAAVAKRLLDWATPRFTWIRWGRGKVDGSFTPMVVKGRRDSFFTVYTSGRIELRFGKLVDMPPFDDAAEREALRASLDQVPGFDIPAGTADLWPNVRLSALDDPEAFASFTSKIEEALKRFEASASAN